MLGMVKGKLKTTQATNIAQVAVFLLVASNHSLVYCFGSSISSFYSAPEFWVNSKRFDGIALNHRAFNQKNDILPTKAMFEDDDCDTFATSGCITYKKKLGDKKITRRSPIWKPEYEEEPSKFFSRNGKGMTKCKNCGLWFLMSDEHGNLSYKQANGPTVERVRKQRLVQGPTRDINPLWTGTRTMWSNLRVLKKADPTQTTSTTIARKPQPYRRTNLNRPWRNLRVMKRPS